MARYDIENLIDDLKTVLQSNLPAKITALNLEKGGTMQLETPDSAAYILQSMDAAHAAYDPFIAIGVLDLPPQEGYAGKTCQVAEVGVLAVVADEGNDLEIWRRLFRYQRAIREVMEENFGFNPGQFQLKIQNQVPVALQLINDSWSHKAIGVTVTAEIG
jgi:hypothetical protein